MRKSLFVIALAAVAGISMAQYRGSHLLASYATALGKIQSISTTYSITPVTGLPEEFKADLSRPNRARLESPKLVVLADGQTIYIYSKKKNAFYKRGQTEDGLKALFSDWNVQFLAPFYNQDAFTSVYDARSPLGGTGAYQSVQFATDEAKTRLWTLFLDPEDSMVKRGRYETKESTGDTTRILHINAWTTDQTPPESFSWSAPAGAREISGDILEAGKWFTNYEEARLAAELSHRVLLLVLGSKSSGESQGMISLIENNSYVKSNASRLVFCRVNIEEQPALAAQFKVRQMPTIYFFRPDGSYLLMGKGVTTEKAFLPLFMSAMARAK